MTRHVIGLRAAAFLTAGIVREPWRTFLFADLGAALVSVPLGFGLGYLFTSPIKGILADMHRVERWLGLGALLVLTIVILVKIWRQYHHPPMDGLVDEGEPPDPERGELGVYSRSARAPLD